MSGEIRLAGRLFNVVNYEVITFACEAYIHKLMRETGLDLPLAFGEHETNTEYQVRLQNRVVDTLKLPELIGGFLLPAGKSETDWDERMAADTAAHIRGLTARDDRQEVFRLGFELNVYFFADGLSWLSNFQKSLASLETPPMAASESSPNPNQIAAH